MFGCLSVEQWSLAVLEEQSGYTLAKTCKKCVIKNFHLVHKFNDNFYAYLYLV